MAFINELTNDEFKELLRPKLRLFLSVDIVGSTAFKHSAKLNANQQWLGFFVSFFTEFNGEFQNARIALQEKLNRQPVDEPRLWKSLGDELVYVVELKRGADTAFYIAAFREAVNKQIQYHSKGEGRLPISFKAAAWLAGFPLGNAALPVRTEAGDESFDFIGPLVDTGFRLAAFSSPRRFTVSVDLALLLLRSGAGDLKFFYDRRESLKGVIENRGYPIIWIDMHDNENGAYEKLEDSLIGREPANSEKLREFCEKFIRQIGDPLILPFICNGEDGMVLPDDYDKRLEDLEVALRKIFIVVEPQGEDTANDEGAANALKEMISRLGNDEGE